MAAKHPHLMLLKVKPDYITNILAQTECPAKFAFRLQRGSRWAKSAIFGTFFGFSNISGELFILEEIFACFVCKGCSSNMETPLQAGGIPNSRMFPDFLYSKVKSRKISAKFSDPHVCFFNYFFRDSRVFSYISYN